MTSPRAHPPGAIRFADNPAHDAAQHDVQAVLDRMAQALSSGDADAMVALWQPPGFVLADPEVHAISANGEVRQFFRGVAPGTRPLRAEIQNLQWPSERIAIVEVRFCERAGSADDDALHWTCTLRRNERGEFKLRVAVQHARPTH